ncbi:hypothetical protein D3C72_1653560 [compost metagenome]
MHQPQTPAAAGREMEPVIGRLKGMIVDVNPTCEALRGYRQPPVTVDLLEPGSQPGGLQRGGTAVRKVDGLAQRLAAVGSMQRDHDHIVRRRAEAIRIGEVEEAVQQRRCFNARRATRRQ